MYWITATRSRPEISSHVGIAVPQRPCVTVIKRSASLGSESFPGVDLNLKIPRVKSRGRRVALGWLGKPGVWRHDRVGHDVTGFPVMRDVPAILVLAARACQFRSDPPGTEEMWMIIRVFSGLGHRTPTKGLPRDRSDILRMAVPAALPDVDVPPTKLQRSVVGHLDLFLCDSVLHRRDAGAW